MKAAPLKAANIMSGFDKRGEKGRAEEKVGRTTYTFSN
jgi:hypothetical protein